MTVLLWSSWWFSSSTPHGRRTDRFTRIISGEGILDRWHPQHAHTHGVLPLIHSLSNTLNWDYCDITGPGSRLNLLAIPCAASAGNMCVCTWTCVRTHFVGVVCVCAYVCVRVHVNLEFNSINLLQTRLACVGMCTVVEFQLTYGALKAALRDRKSVV